MFLTLVNDELRRHAGEVCKPPCGVQRYSCDPTMPLEVENSRLPATIWPLPLMRAGFLTDGGDTIDGLNTSSTPAALLRLV